MVRTASTMLALGTTAPDFRLPNVVSGALQSLDEIAAGQPVLVMFICRHCPYVKHVERELAALARDYAGRPLAIVGISANDPAEYPEDAPESLREWVTQAGLSFPVLFDETQDVARAYTAACTPDFFLFDEGRTLVYRGQLDDSRPNSGKPVTGRDLRAALDAVLEHRPVSPDQRPSLGCNIKWKRGREPQYFRR